MAGSTNIVFNITGNTTGLKKATDDAQKQLKSLDKANLKKFSKALDDAGKSAVNFGKKMTTHVTLPIVAGLGMAAKAAIDDAKSLAGLNKVAKNAGFTSKQLKSLDEWTNKQQLRTATDDDAIRAIEKFGIATGVTAGNLKQYVTVVQNMGAGLGKGATAIQRLLQPVLADPTGAKAKAFFSKYGFTPEQIAGVKTAGDALELIGTKFDGVAEAQAKKDPFGQMKQAADQLFGTIGKSLAPAITDLTTKFTDFWKKNQKKIERFVHDHGELLIKILLIVAAIGPLTVVFGKLFQGLSILMNIMNVMTAMIPALVSFFSALAMDGTVIGAIFMAFGETAAGIAAVALPVAAVVAAIVILIGLFVLLFNKNKGFHDAVVRLWNNIKQKVGEVVGAIGDWWHRTVDGMSQWWRQNGAKIIEAMTHVKNVLAPIFQYMLLPLKIALGGIKGVFEVVFAVFKAGWELIKGSVMIVVSLINGDLSGALQAVSDMFAGLGDAAKGALNGIADAIGGAFIGGLNALIDVYNSLPVVIRKALAHVGLPEHIGHIGGGGNGGGVDTSWNPGGRFTRAANSGDNQTQSITRGHRAIGGYVPGRPGQAVPMTLHAGELVLTKAQAARMGGGAGDQNIVVNMTGTNASPADVAREVAWALKTSGR